MSEQGRAGAALLGLGTVGAALAVALKGSGRFTAVVGWDPDFDTARRAQKHAVADRYAGTAPDAVRQAAVVFLAVGPAATGDTLTAIAPHLRPGAIVCGLDADQERVSGQAAALLPANVSFVAGHPVLWDLPGPDAAPSPALFKHGVLCLSPSPAAHPDAVAYLTGLADALELTPFFVGAREHDAFVTGVERLPSVLAAAYLRVVTRERSWRELGRVAGGPFRQLGALAGADPAEAQQGLAASREHLVRWLDAVMGELGALRDALQDGREPDDFYAGAADAWRTWQRDRELDPQAAELPEPPPIPRRRFPF
jgi:prephenate dehydrogenase